MNPPRCSALASLSLLSAAGLALAGPHDRDPLTSAAIIEQDDPVPWGAWSFGVDVGLQWRVTDNSSADYLVVPTVLSLRSPAHWEWDFAGGKVVTRARLNLLLQGVADGPESYYFGWSGSPSVEYWFPSQRSSLFFSIGGGSGWVDSHPDVEGAQGRDYTYNWFMHGGVRKRVGARADLSLGVFFQHWSNRGATDPNPGFDGLGPMIGLSWDF